MTSSRRVTVVAAVAALGAASVTIAAAAVAVTRVDWSASGSGELAAACRAWVLASLATPSLLVLVLGGVSVAAIVRVLRSVLRQMAATRRLEQRLCVVGPLEGVPRGHRIASPHHEAFCLGWLRPRIYVTESAATVLAPRSLQALVAHERHHARCRDPLRQLIGRSLADGLFFLPGRHRLAERNAEMAEIAADRAAVAAVGGPGPLAAALLAFEAHGSRLAAGIHPERVDALAGRRVGAKLPARSLAVSATVCAALAMVVVTVSDVAGQASLGLPALGAHACMIAMALLPAALCVALLMLGRRAVAAVGRLTTTGYSTSTSTDRGTRTS